MTTVHPNSREGKRRRKARMRNIAYNSNNKEKTKAQNAIKRAVKKGLLPKIHELRCRAPGCDNYAHHYHHWSYKEENHLSVIPVCWTCHIHIHNGTLDIGDPLGLAVHLSPVCTP